MKLLWLVDAEQPGPVIVRGTRVDKRGPVAFTGGGTGRVRAYPLTGDVTSTAPPTWRDIPSQVQIRGPGCYHLQVDGTDFQSVFLLRASSREEQGGATRVMTPEETLSSLRETCEMEDLSKRQPEGPVPRPDFTKVPLWIPVINLPAGGFMGCAPRILAYPELDEYATEAAFAIRAGVPGHTPPLPTFRPDGTLSGYLIPENGFVLAAEVTPGGLLQSALVDIPASPLEFSAIIGPEPTT